MASAQQARDFVDIEASIAPHRGAIDQTTITTQPPLTVIKQVNAILRGMGVEIQEESTFRYRCIRPKKSDDRPSPTQSAAALDSPPPVNVNPRGTADSEHCDGKCTLYGSSMSDDPADEVRFSIEVTKLAGLNGTYSLDIRRLKGHLKSYKFVYDTIRDRAELNR